MFGEFSNIWSCPKMALIPLGGTEFPSLKGMRQKPNNYLC